MKTCVHSANFGNFDHPVVHEPQINQNVDFFSLNDSNFPTRQRSMSNRLRARIPKMFGWDLFPGYDCYIWLDGSIRLSKPDSVEWFHHHLGDGDIAVFEHPIRRTIAEEADYLRAKLEAGSHYIKARYEGEDLEGQMKVIEESETYADSRLFASGAFIYCPRPHVISAMKEWWYHTSRFHVIDQLAFPYALRGCSVRLIQEDIYHASHIEWRKHA